MNKLQFLTIRTIGDSLKNKKIFLVEVLYSRQFFLELFGLQGRNVVISASILLSSFSFWSLLHFTGSPRPMPAHPPTGKPPFGTGATKDLAFRCGVGYKLAYWCGLPCTGTILPVLL
jgi:hypothetical protein